MNEEFVMPGFFELLSMADFDAALFSTLDYLKGVGTLNHLKRVGFTGMLAVLAIGGAWLFLVLGLATRVRALLGVSALAALGAMLVGWAGAYMGYLSASRTVEAARMALSDSQLIDAATVMVISGLSPTVLVFLPLLLAVTVMPFIGRKSE